MSEMSERGGLAALLAAHRLYGEDGDDVFECGCGAKSPPEALEEDFGEQLWHERHVAELLTARVADAAAAARAEVVEAVTSPEAIEAGARALKSRNHAAAVYKFHRWDAEVVVTAVRNLLAPPVDHAHAADGTEVGA